MLRPKKLSQSGFTGIELLIVLTIVIIVALLVANNISEAVAKGRDIERRSDIDAIQDALEQYWHSEEHYPTDLTALGLNIDVLTDPSGNSILIATATDSDNQPATSYTAGARPEQEYTYAPYQCGSETDTTEVIEETGATETSNGNEAGTEETETAADEVAPLTADACQKYVLYSWLEKAETTDVPYRKSNFHNLD